MKLSFRTIAGFLGFLLLAISVFQIQRASNGLEIIKSEREGVPVTIIIPKNHDPKSLPIVLIGHGFAGSSVLMRSFAYPIAYAGYAAVLWDFDGHGSNPRPLPPGISGDTLVRDAEIALQEARILGIGDHARLAILGHSMGSGVAMTFGQIYPETSATIAVSPVGTSVTPQLPRNLLLMAGENEPGFIQNAITRLAEAGGTGGDPRAGTARQLRMIPWVEHITIVFSPIAHAAAKEWLDAVFGLQPGAVDYTDFRVFWYGIGVLGALVAASAFIPKTRVIKIVNEPIWRKLLALLGGSLSATLLLFLIERLGVSLAQSFGLLVGGYLLLWFAVAGTMAAFILGIEKSLFVRPDLQIIITGLIVAASLWLGVGLLGNDVWLPWMLIPQRLFLWPVAVVLMLPWFYVVGRVNSNAFGWSRLGWFLVNCVAVLGSLFLALQISDGLFFLLLILPVFPFILGVHTLVAIRQINPWAFGLSASLFISWAVLAVFPQL